MNDMKPAKSTDERLDALELEVFGRQPDPAHIVMVGETRTLAIGARDAQGHARDLPVGDTFKARVSSSVYMDVGIGAASGGGPALIVTGLKPARDVLAMVDDTQGLLTVAVRLDVVAQPARAVEVMESDPDPAPVALTLDILAAAPIEPKEPAQPAQAGRLALDPLQAE